VLVNGLSDEAQQAITSRYNVDVIDYQQSVPDDAVSISDRDEAPDDAQVVSGPRGGLYYIPPGDDGDAGDVTPKSELTDRAQEALESGDRGEVRDMISNSVGVERVELPRGMSDEDLADMAGTLSFAGEVGLTEQVEAVETHISDEYGYYRFNDGTLSFNSDLDMSEFEEYDNEGEAVGDDMEWLVTHELGHAEHDGVVDDMVGSDEFFDQNLAVTRDGEWVGRERVDLVDDEVSSYARTNPSEFVAEVYAGLATGQEFSDEVMDIYDEFDGPGSWQDYRGEQE